MISDLIVNSELQSDEVSGERNCCHSLSSDISVAQPAHNPPLLNKNRLITGQIEVFEMMATGRCLNCILDRIASLIEEVAGNLNCLIFLLESGQTHLRAVAAPSLPAEFKAALQALPLGMTSGTCGAAALLKCPQISPDVAKDSRWAPFLDFITLYGVKASWSSPIFDADNEVLGVMCLLYGELHDPESYEQEFVSVATHLASIAIQRVHSEEKLLVSERKFRALVEKSYGGISLVGGDGKLVYASAAERFFGYKPDELLGCLAESRVHPDDWVALNLRVQMLKSGDSFSQEYRVRHKNGSWVWAEGIVTNLLDEPGVSAYVVNFRDIAERKQAEEDLRASEERYRSLVAALNEGIVLMDRNLTIVTCNASAERILGLNRDEITGRTTFDPRWRTIHEDGSEFPGETHPVTITLRTGQACSNVVMGVHKPDGSLAWISINTQPLFRKDEITPYAIVASFADITDRKLAEAEIRESEERFSKAFTSNPNPMAIITFPEGRYVNVNEAWLKAYSYTLEEVVGRTALELNLWLRPQERAKLYGHLQEHGFCKNLEADFVSKDGRICQIVISTEIIEFGRKKYVLASSYDLTERKHAEDALRISEERFAKAFGASPQPMAIMELPNRVFVNVNEAMARISGCSAEEIIGTSPQMLNFWSREEDRQRVIELLAQNGFVHEFETQFTTAAGSIVEILLSAERITFNGAPHVLIVASDITARKKAERALRESEEHYRLLFEHSFAGVVRMTADGVGTECNEALARMLGCNSREELIEADDELFYFDLNERQQLINELLEHGSLRNRELLMRRLDGSPVWTLLNGSVFRSNEQGQPMLEGVVLDISERKLTEKKLEELYNQSRTLLAKLETVREEERIRIAREIHDNLGQILTGLKLDFSWLDKRLAKTTDENLLRKTEPKLKEIAALLEEAIQTVRTIATELRPGVLDTLGLRAAINWQAKEFERRNQVTCLIKLDREPENLPEERATAIFRIFQEILTNITRHAKASRVKIEMIESNDDLLLTVADNGVGITEAQRLDPKSLGLLGMRERAEMFGGTVTIKGKSRQGTTVRVKIPVKK